MDSSYLDRNKVGVRLRRRFADITYQLSASRTRRLINDRRRNVTRDHGYDRASSVFRIVGDRWDPLVMRREPSGTYCPRAVDSQLDGVALDRISPIFW